jgi:hypothetical protein
MPLNYDSHAGVCNLIFVYDDFAEKYDNIRANSAHRLKSIGEIGNGIFSTSKEATRGVLKYYGNKIKKGMLKTSLTRIIDSLYYRRSKDEVEKMKKKYGITKDYFLLVGNLENHNHNSFLKSLNNFSQKDIENFEIVTLCNFFFNFYKGKKKI